MPVLRLQQALDSFRASDWLQSGPSAGGSYPPLNVFRKGPDLVLLAELPGVKKSELDVQVKGRTIRLAGSKDTIAPEGASAHRRERLSGRFDRALTLPIEIDPDRVRADYHDGMLALLLPAAEHAKPKSIKVS